MNTEKEKWNSKNFDQLMKESKKELVHLREEMQNLMVRFSLRALRTYQAARNEPLRPREIASLVRYEIENVIHDISELKSKEAIINRAKMQWEKQQE
jgi:hypothetical protein